MFEKDSIACGGFRIVMAQLLGLRLALCTIRLIRACEGGGGYTPMIVKDLMQKQDIGLPLVEDLLGRSNRSSQHDAAVSR